MLSTVVLAIFLLNDAAAIQVHVRDGQGGSISRAAVTLHTRDGRVRLTAVTGASGTYVFSSLAPGEYLVDVEASGFRRAEAQVARIESGGRAELTFTLELAAIEEQVVVTASGTAQTVDEVSKALTVVDLEAIDARDEYEVSEALRTVPGLRVQQLGGPGSFTVIRSRGLRTEDTAILLDGQRLRDAAAPQGDASALIEGLMVTDLDRIEILRGSGSSLYGTNAVGGVINIVTREGGGRPRGSALAEGGSLELFRGRALLAGGASGDRFTGSLGLSQVNVGGGVDGDDPLRNTSLQGILRLRLTPDATLAARFYLVDSRVGLNESPEAVGTIPPSGIIAARPLASSELDRYEQGVPIPDLQIGNATFIPSANDPDNRRETTSFASKVTLEQRPREGVGWSVSYQGLTTDRTFLDGPLGVSFFEPGAETRSDFDGRIHALQARTDFEWGRAHLVTAGYELESETYESRAFPVDPAEDSAIDVNQKSHTFFVQDQVRLMEGALQISGAFRTQVFSLREPDFTPGAGSPYQGIDFEAPPAAYTGDGSVAYFVPRSGTKIRGHVGNGYRAPSLYERFGASFSSFGYFVFGDPRLAPDRTIAFDAGVDQELLDRKLRVSATYFHTWLREVVVFDFSGAIDPTTDPFGRFGGYRNTEGGRARGLELAATATPGQKTVLALSYTYTDSTQGTPVIEDIERAFVVPNHQFSFVASHALTDALSVVFDLALSSSYLAPVFDPGTFASRVYRFDGIGKADVGASYRAGKMRLFGKVENLVGQTYFENGFRTAGRTATGGVAFEF